MTPADDTPVLFAYDGSDHAKAAIAAAGRELRDGRRAIVLTVWQPLEAVGFGAPLAGVVPEVGESIVAEAERVAGEGVALAEDAGFHAEPGTARGAPTWDAILQVADEQDAGIIVMGSHGRTGVTALVMGSVATSVAHHATRPVLIVPRHSG